MKDPESSLGPLSLGKHPQKYVCGDCDGENVVWSEATCSSVIENSQQWRYQVLPLPGRCQCPSLHIRRGHRDDHMHLSYLKEDSESLSPRPQYSDPSFVNILQK